MTRNLDPDRRRPGPTHPGYDPREIDVDMDICRWCAALVPADEAHRIKHEDWDQRIANRFAQLIERVALLEAGLAAVALTSQLSGSGSNAEPTGSDSPDPDSNVPTPEQEATAGRSGVGDAKDTQADAAGLPSGSVTGAPAVTPRAAGATNRSRPGPGAASTGRLPLGADPGPDKPSRNPWLRPTPGGPPDPGTHPGGPPGTPPSRLPLTIASPRPDDPQRFAR